jgi:hypothetical protein
MTFQTSPLDPFASAIQVWLNEGKTNGEIVSLLKKEFDIESSETSVRRAIERHQLIRPEKTEQARPEPAGVRIENDTAVITTDLTEEQLGDAEGMITARGLDPEDWILERVIINEWEGFYKNDSNVAEKVPLRQFKLFLKKKLSYEFVSPAVHIPEVIRKPHGTTSAVHSKLVVIVGDEQEPYGDPTLKGLFLNWLDENQPDQGVHLGDLMDLPTISRHKDNPEWAASVQECVNAGYATLRSYIDASPSTQWKLMVGNHDERIRNELLLRAERMYGIRPADVDGQEQEEALSLKRLLHLDALGIDFVDPKGAYAHASVKLTDKLQVRHGWLTGNNAAQSSLGRLGHSIIVGHTHHQRVHYKTIYDIDGNRQILQGVEAGTMCNPHKGIGYAVDPDWQQGFATATIWPDGSFNIELATYNNGVLNWRDQRYS